MRLLLLPFPVYRAALQKEIIFTSSVHTRTDVGESETKYYWLPLYPNQVIGETENQESEEWNLARTTHRVLLEQLKTAYNDSLVLEGLEGAVVDLPRGIFLPGSSPSSAVGFHITLSSEQAKTLGDKEIEFKFVPSKLSRWSTLRNAKNIGSGTLSEKFNRLHTSEKGTKQFAEIALLVLNGDLLYRITSQDEWKSIKGRPHITCGALWYPAGSLKLEESLLTDKEIPANDEIVKAIKDIGKDIGEKSKMLTVIGKQSTYNNYFASTMKFDEKTVVQLVTADRNAIDEGDLFEVHENFDDGTVNLLTGDITRYLFLWYNDENNFSVIKIPIKVQQSVEKASGPELHMRGDVMLPEHRRYFRAVLREWEAEPVSEEGSKPPAKKRRERQPANIPEMIDGTPRS